MKLKAVLFLTLAVAQTSAAQTNGSQTSSPIMDMVERAKNSLDNLNYAMARAAAQEILTLRLKRNQEIAALQVASAAYFPEEHAARVPDSARIYMRRLARLSPSGGFPPDLFSPGLDSLFGAVRRTVFGASAQAPLRMTLRGVETQPAIDVASTRPARWQLFLVTNDGPPVLLDTIASAVSGRFVLRAHTGSAPVILPGNHQFRILAISSFDPDTITLRFDGVATGAIPSLVDLPPALDSSRLLRERAPRALGAGIAAGLVTGTATWALSNQLRPPGAIGDENKDGRAMGVAVGISLGALAGGLLDRGKPLPANIKANASLRSTYLKQLGDATETNRKRVAEYSVALAIDPEIK